MDLKIKDLVEWLQVPEKTIYGWIQENRIPCYRINHQYRFSRSEINEWILKNKVDVSDRIMASSDVTHPSLLPALLRNGDIYYDVPGQSVKDVLKNAIDLIPTPPQLDKELVLSYLVQREEMMSTAVGNGIAIPHPRNPIISDIESECVAICFLKNDIDFHALDKLPVHTLFIILSANATRHLDILSKIGYLCRQEVFLALLRKRAPREEVFACLEQEISKWRRP